MRPMLCALLALSACTEDVTALYNTHRDYALEGAGAVPRSWKPEVSLSLSPALVSAMLETGLNQAAHEVEPVEVGRVATVTPTATVQRIELVEDADCDDCITFRARLKGDARIKAGSLKQTLPFTAKIRASLRFETRADGSSRWIEARATAVDRVELEIGEGNTLRVDLDQALEKWGEQLIAEVPPYAVAELGGDDLVVRDLRLLPQGQGLRIEVLTNAAHGGALKKTSDLPDSGWQALIAEPTLLDFARREAFNRGEIAMGVHAEPTALDVDGDRFTLDLRLWRLEGNGWWRDYRIEGALAVQGKLVTFKPEAVGEIDKSDGAELADPLAALGQSLILDAIQDAAAQAVPAAERSRVDGLELAVVVREAKGQGDALLLAGDATLQTARRGATPSRKGAATSSATQGSRKK
ncbi:MAG: hypothetical protein H6739_24075 [Alphaproteobacteria bacterium]|nr:hypothetical protein [Alphaproteobacteria bacterium]